MLTMLPIGLLVGLVGAYPNHRAVEPMTLDDAMKFINYDNEEEEEIYLRQTITM